MKYIVINHTDLYAFPRHISHDDHLNDIIKPGQVCTGAGFVRRTDTGWECHGESDSLGIPSSPRDNILLKIFLDMR
jgi:hypothetical protein